MTNLLSFKQDLVARHSLPLPFIARDGRKFSFHWISDCPTNDLLALRNAPHVLEFVNGRRPISIDDHRGFISDYFSKARLDFVIYCDTSKEWVGGVSVVQKEHYLEMGKYIGHTGYLGGGVGKGASIAFLEYLKGEFPPSTTIVARTKTNNHINISLNEDIGFSIVEWLPDDFVLMRRVL
jgi:RimJ/RimL family protein N-acetyltransferase